MVDNEVGMFKSKSRCKHRWIVKRTIQQTKETNVKNAKDAFEKCKMAGVQALVYRQKECKNDGCAVKICTVELQWKKLKHIINEHGELSGTLETLAGELKNAEAEIKQLKQKVKDLKKESELIDCEAGLYIDPEIVKLEAENSELQIKLKKATELGEEHADAVCYMAELVQKLAPSVYVELLERYDRVLYLTERAPVHYLKSNPRHIPGGRCSPK